MYIGYTCILTLEHCFLNLMYTYIYWKKLVALTISLKRQNKVLSKVTADMCFTYSRHATSNWENIDGHEEVEMNRWHDGAKPRLFWGCSGSALWKQTEQVNGHDHGCYSEHRLRSQLNRVRRWGYYLGTEINRSKVLSMVTHLPWMKTKMVRV